jgi:hypothetical protein
MIVLVALKSSTLAHAPSPAVASAPVCKVMDTGPLCSHCPVDRGAPLHRGWQAPIEQMHRLRNNVPVP